MYTSAQPDWLPALKGLWLSSFPGDTPEDVEAFLESNFQAENCFVALEGTVPVSMTFALPARFHGEGNSFPVQYIYAACTRPESRGQGIFSGLLRYALEQGESRGQAASFLRPGEISLTAYYGRFGYRPFFTNCTRVIEKNCLPSVEGQNGSCRRISPEDYAAVRNSCLQENAAWVEWTQRQAAYAARNAERAGGGGWRNDGACLLCEPKETELFVRELIGKPEDATALLACVAADFTAARLRVSGPAEGSDAECFGLWRPLSSEGDRLCRLAGSAYMGLSLE